VKHPRPIAGVVALILVGAFAAFCLSSSLFAIVILVATIAFVLIDMFGNARLATPAPDPHKITIDLSRRG
jgi:hypothetical protein